MISANYNIQIEINGQQVDIFSQSDLNLRMNLVLYDPTKVNGTSNEYSFSFELPRTARNCQIMDFVDLLPKRGKFNKVFTAVVYADGNLIFEGVYKVSEINEDAIKGNLVDIRISDLDGIFGDSVMADLKWYVPYTGVSTINSVNHDSESKYFFPMVCYGAFQKKPRLQIEEYTDYSSLFTIDDTNRWYDESFIPSMNYCELVKRLFKAKGYKVAGKIFDDPVASKVFLSNYIDNDQVPTYNIGGDRGKLTVNWQYRNSYATTSVTSGRKFIPTLQQSLMYPKMPTGKGLSEKGYNYEVTCNHDIFTDILNNREKDSSLYVDYNNTEMFRDGVIIIPADGLYKIEMEGTLSLNDINGATFSSWVNPKINEKNKDTSKEGEVTFTTSWATAPVEIQLVRNENETELIGSFDEDINGRTIYPHQAPTEYSLIANSNTGGTVVRHNPNIGNASTGGADNSGSTYYGPRGATGGLGSVTYGSSRRGTGSTTTASTNASRKVTIQNGYVPKVGEIVAYDPIANPYFICGATSIGKDDNGTRKGACGVIKNGRSWDTTLMDRNYSGYICDGYFPYKGGTWGERTEYNINTLNGAVPCVCQDVNSRTKRFTINCVVYLRKNDVLMLKGLSRYLDFTDSEIGRLSNTDCATYPFSTTGTLRIEALSPNYMDLKGTDFNYNMVSKFDKDLNLGQFLSVDEKQVDFVNDFIKVFNLSTSIKGKTVEFRTNNMANGSWIDFDNRVALKDINIMPIEFPLTYEVKFDIDDEEAGFYKSVEDSGHINDDDWKDWAERGSAPIQMNNPLLTDEKTEIQLKKSYCWYMMFNKGRQTISMPVIAKDEYFIDGGDYEEYMRVDGRSLKQRMFFRRGLYVDLPTTVGETVTPELVKNTSDEGIDINYYPTDKKSFFNRYFKVAKNRYSNYIEFEAYLTYEEYEQLKQGYYVKIDSDLYIPSKVTGFDPTGKNKTKITAIKA